MRPLTWEVIEETIPDSETDLVINKVLMDDFPYEHTGNELEFPSISNMFQMNNLIPLISFAILFRCISAIVKKYLWIDVQGPRQYRLRNLTVSFLHSLISGSFALFFACFHYDAIFLQPVHWYQPWSRYGLLFSIGYFFHDIFDMLQHEVSRVTIELMMHHIFSIFAFGCAVSTRKFVPFAYCALLMEFNSIFLHIRALMQLTKTSSIHPLFYKIIQRVNFISFIIFRFVIQTWQICWIFQNYDLVHPFFVIFGFLGSITFLIMNGFLFTRMLASDGLLGDYGRKNAAANEDDDDDAAARLLPDQ